MLYFTRLLIFIFISCGFHLLLLLLELAPQAAINSAPQHGVGYVVRSVEQFIVSSPKSSVLVEVTSAETESIKPVEKKTVNASAKPFQQKIKKSVKPSRPTVVLREPVKHQQQEVEQIEPVIEENVQPFSTEPELADNADSLSSPATARKGTPIKPAVDSGEVKSPGSVKAVGRFVKALPRYDSNPLPIYPEVARRRGQQGTVKIEVLVLENGRVGESKTVVSSGHQILDQAAQKAVRFWRFKPATSFGKPIESRVIVPIGFERDLE